MIMKSTSLKIGTTINSKFKKEILRARMIAEPKTLEGNEPDMVKARKNSRRAVFSAATRFIALLIREHILSASSAKDRKHVRSHLGEGRKVFQSFQETLPYVDPVGWKKMQIAWLDAFSNLGSPGIMGVGSIPINLRKIRSSLEIISNYMNKNFINVKKLNRKLEERITLLEEQVEILEEGK